MTTLGIASIPQRKDSLIAVLNSVISHVDEVFVVLNDYQETPQELRNMRNVNSVIMSNSFYGDGAKMYMADQVKGYYISWDDDLLMPSGCVDYLRKGVDRYNAVCGLHGKTYPYPVTGFRRWTGNYRCLNTVAVDTRVNFIGSGCTMWNTDRLKMSVKQVLKPNMCDLWLSKACAEQSVPMYVLKHRIGYLQYIAPSGATIWGQTKDYSYHVKVMNEFIKPI